MGRLFKISWNKIEFIPFRTVHQTYYTSPLAEIAIFITPSIVGLIFCSISKDKFSTGSNSMVSWTVYNKMMMWQESFEKNYMFLDLLDWDCQMIVIKIFCKSLSFQWLWFLFNLSWNKVFHWCDLFKLRFWFMSYLL